MRWKELNMKEMMISLNIVVYNENNVNLFNCQSWKSPCLKIEEINNKI